MALIKKRVFIQTSEAVTDPRDGFPKTDLYFDGYNVLSSTTKGFDKSEDEAGKEVYNEVMELDNSIILDTVEY